MNAFLLGIGIPGYVSVAPSGQVVACTCFGGVIVKGDAHHTITTSIRIAMQMRTSLYYATWYIPQTRSEPRNPLAA
ncbi:MAG: hypothetical protein KDD67_17700 [Ignavibacteriae bacterium]|nr:hypothetical protein [Ignavibacteriota bacterium]MCB9216856.1 hypothetical protein [Ignavibacteria bacterium]